MAHHILRDTEAEFPPPNGEMTVSSGVQNESTESISLTEFKSETTIDVPVVDIVSYAMARLDEHDRDFVVSIAS